MSPRRTLLFGVFSICLIWAHADVLRALFTLAWTNDTASHLVLVPFVTVGLIYGNRKEIFSTVRWDWIAGLAVTASGAAIALAASTLVSQVAGLVILWVGGFLLCFGRQAFRFALFPLLFLVFMIPIPQSLLNAAVQLLKVGSTEMVAALFTLTGTPYHREGFVFSLPAFRIVIADECSGIRSSIALLISSVLAGHTFLKSPWNKLLLIVAVLPVAILKNGIRIVSLSLLATHVNPEFLTGQLHQEGGIVFFALSLGILLPILALLRRSEARLASVW